MAIQPSKGEQLSAAAQDPGCCWSLKCLPRSYGWKLLKLPVGTVSRGLLALPTGDN